MNTKTLKLIEDSEYSSLLSCKSEACTDYFEFVQDDDLYNAVRSTCVFLCQYFLHNYLHSEFDHVMLRYQQLVSFEDIFNDSKYSLNSKLKVLKKVKVTSRELNEILRLHEARLIKSKNRYFPCLLKKLNIACGDIEIPVLNEFIAEIFQIDENNLINEFAKNNIRDLDRATLRIHPEIRLA